MPYEGEFASYRSINRIAQDDRVKQFLIRSRVMAPSITAPSLNPQEAPPANAIPVSYAVAIDGSYADVLVKNGYPGASVGYVTVTSVLLDLLMLERLDEIRPIDPVAFRKTEQADTIDSVLPGSNVLTRDHRTACSAFREELFDVLHSACIDSDDPTTLLDTFNHLLSLKPRTSPQKCPCTGCDEEFLVTPTSGTCACPRQCRIYPTDSLRIHERFNEFGSNGEAFGLVMQTWERVLLIHFLRCFERKNILKSMGKLVLFVDGPLAMFGPPAWISAAISKELKRLNVIVQAQTGNDLMIVGVEKTGAFVEHFEGIDQAENGKFRFEPRTYALLTDTYIKSRIALSDSDRRYGQDTYFGRKFFYKTASGDRIVASIPFLNDAQDTLDSDDVTLYPQFGNICTILDKLRSSRYPNSLTPIISAHGYASIPVRLGSKVLQQLALALMAPNP